MAPWGDEPRELHLCGASIGLQRACHRHSHVECHATRILAAASGLWEFWTKGLSDFEIGFVKFIWQPWHQEVDTKVASTQAIGATLASGSLRNYLHCVRH